MDAALTHEQEVERRVVYYAENGDLDSLLALYEAETDLVLKQQIEAYINDNAYKIALVSGVLPPEQMIDLPRLRGFRDLKYFREAIVEFNIANIENLFAQTRDKEIDLSYLQELLDLLNYESRKIKSVSHTAIYFSVLVLHKQRLEEEYIWQGQVENIQSIIDNPASYASSEGGRGKLAQAKLVKKAVEDFRVTVADFAADLPDKRYNTFLKNLRSVDKDFAKEVKRIADEKRAEAEEETEDADLDLEREENED